MTDEEPLLDELLRFERALAERDAGAVEGGLDEFLDPGFFEFGAGGRAWDRGSTLAALDGSRRWLELQEVELRRLGDDAALLTYRIVAPTASLRSSIWHRSDGRWRLVFHQGTPAE